MFLFDAYVNQISFMSSTWVGIHATSLHYNPLKDMSKGHNIVDQL